MDQKTRYKLLALAVLSAARALLRGVAAGAILDILEEDVLLNWDTIWAKSTKKNAFTAKIGKIAKGIKVTEPFAAFVQCCEEMEK